MRTFKFSMDTGTAGKNLNRLSKGLSATDTARFEGMLVAGWADAVSRAHVQTGALKNSLQIESVATPTTWQGSLKSTHHGVFELARGETHYYHHGIKNDHMGHDQMVEGVISFMKGGKL